MAPDPRSRCPHRSLIFSSGVTFVFLLVQDARLLAHLVQKILIITPAALRRALRHSPRACQPAVWHFRGGCSDTLEVSDAPHTAVGRSVAGRRLCLTTAQQRKWDKTLHVLVDLASQVTR